MGSLKKLAEWLSGGFEDDERTTSPLIKIKVFNKRLSRQIKKMEMHIKMAKKRAIEARQSGDIKGSKLHMKSSLQYKKWAHSTEHFRMKMEGVQYKLEQAKIMGQFSKVAEDVVGTLKGLQLNVKMPEMVKMINEMDLGFGNMEEIMNETTSQLESGEAQSSETSISEDEVAAALEEVDAQFGLETAMALPSVPIDETPEAQIDNLEDEIKRLKEKRT